MDRRLATNRNPYEDEQNLTLTLATPSSNPNPERNIIPSPYPWVTNRRATIRPLHDILSLNITTITDNLKCPRCDYMVLVTYNIVEKYQELRTYIITNQYNMIDRAPPEWLSPPLPLCAVCRGGIGMKPVITGRKRNINWLFLLLGQTIGCCNGVQLKYFCKHTRYHRSGSKSHLVYLTYIGLCKQLEPNSFPAR